MAADLREMQENQGFIVIRNYLSYVPAEAV